MVLLVVGVVVAPCAVDEAAQDVTTRHETHRQEQRGYKTPGPDKLNTLNTQFWCFPSPKPLPNQSLDALGGTIAGTCLYCTFTMSPLSPIVLWRNRPSHLPTLAFYT